MKKKFLYAVYIFVCVLLVNCAATRSSPATTLTIAPGAPPTGTVGTPYGGTHYIRHFNPFVTFTYVGWPLTASGGVPGYKWSWAPELGSSLPPGLTVETLTLRWGGGNRCCIVINVPVIGGTPTAAGTYYVVVTLTDSASPAAQTHAAYIITIAKSAAAASSSEPTVSSLTTPSSGQHSRYELIDLGTLGGPNSFVTSSVLYGSIFSQSISAQGVFAGQADTSTPDPFAPNCFNPDCFASHTIEWKDGRIKDLGTLSGPAGLSSTPTWISGNSQIAGFSENGVIDPFISAPAVHGVVWKQGKITDLGVLGNGYESAAFSINNRGEVAGVASDLKPGSNSFFGVGTHSHAVIWRNGSIQDLGNLGGTDDKANAVALYVNERGQVAGASYTADSFPVPGPECGDPGSLTPHGFFWENGKMVDIGTLGGSCTFSYFLNNRGQIVGQSTIAGDLGSHPFLWEKGKIKDLGTLGGDHGYSAWVNDSGEVVGAAANQHVQNLLAFHWKDGVMSSLGTLKGDSCSAADAINSSGLTVGGSGFSVPPPYFPGCTDPVEHAVLWENGQIFDLNLLVTNPSDMILTEATSVNDKGEIGGFGTLPNFDTHAFLLIPCDEKNPSEGCDDANPDVLSTQKTTAPIAATPATANQISPLAGTASSPVRVRRSFHPRASVLARPGLSPN